jgi:hypothetical protein
LALLELDQGLRVEGHRKAMTFSSLPCERTSFERPVTRAPRGQVPSSRRPRRDRCPRRDDLVETGDLVETCNFVETGDLIETCNFVETGDLIETCNFVETGDLGAILVEIGPRRARPTEIGTVVNARNQVESEKVIAFR